MDDFLTLEMFEPRLYTDGFDRDGKETDGASGLIAKGISSSSSTLASTEIGFSVEVKIGDLRRTGAIISVELELSEETSYMLSALLVLPVQVAGSSSTPSICVVDKREDPSSFVLKMRRIPRYALLSPKCATLIARRPTSSAVAIILLAAAISSPSLVIRVACSSCWWWTFGAGLFLSLLLPPPTPKPMVARPTIPKSNFPVPGLVPSIPLEARARCSTISSFVIPLLR
mmetsp:Transcript_18340/g.39951  ORF Transcript_18340/g.39951 Transcript_18340/m.39951 type:complete len:229 (-) Transcript_18340:2183-2869(-)